MEDLNIVFIAGLAFLAVIFFLVLMSRSTTVQQQQLPPAVQQPSIVSYPTQPQYVQPFTSQYVTPQISPVQIPLQGPAVQVPLQIPSSAIIAPTIISRGPAPLLSPSPSADLQTVLNYLLARGGTLDGVAFSSAMKTALLTPTHWVVAGDNAYTYSSGLNTQSSYEVYYDNATGFWNIRGIA